MTIKTFSSFFYIDAIDETNNYLNFKEPNDSASEKTTVLVPNGYSMSQLASEVARALNDVGVNDYTVTFDRINRRYIVDANDTFELLADSGSNNGISVLALIGFDGADQTGGSSYTGATAGKNYRPQFRLQGYKSFLNNLENVQASVNESAEGDVEVVTFGSRRFMECNIKYITDAPRSKGAPIENNSNGVQDARDFLEFIIAKNNIEFIEDEKTPSNFEICLLESTRKSAKGIGYELDELIGEGLDGYFQTGRLKFRKV